MGYTVSARLMSRTFPRGKGSHHYSGGRFSLSAVAAEIRFPVFVGLLASFLLTGGCASDETRSGDALAAAVSAPVAQKVPPKDPELLLLKASQALESGRLTRPRGDNAAAWYRQVLHMDPGNSEAIRGSRKVVRQLILRGLEAARSGDYRTAEIDLTRAQQVDFGHPGIANARVQIREWFATSVEDRRIAPQELAERMPAVRLMIEDIAEKIVENDANFEIHARNDADGVWLYQELVRSIGDQPLHGRILAGREPMIRVIYLRY